MASSLPPEIWFVIVEYLPCGDQLCIAQVSSQLCAVARGIVYRNVELRSNAVTIEATLALLTRDHSVARVVKRLRIHTTAETTQEPIWFNTDVLTGMTNLHGLDLIGMPFHTKDDQLKFNNAISESLPALRQLEYCALYPKIVIPETHVPVLHITGLQEIRWVGRDIFKHPFLIFPSIHASRETLTHIHMPVFAGYARTYDPLIQFFSLRFPRLSTLHFGGWNAAIPAGAALTNFLIVHPLIEDLHLGFSYSYTKSHMSLDVVLGSGTLPNLRCLTVDAFNLGILVRNGISSLQTLESLHIGTSYLEEEDVEFAEMYRRLETCGGLPGLKVLELELEGLNGNPGIASWIRGFGKLCPKVERFWGDHEVGWKVLAYQDILASYCNLKSQVLPATGLRDLLKRDRRNYVREFAVRNPSVTDMRFYAPSHVDVIKFHYRIGRDVDGGITTMVEILENGTEII